MNQLSRIGEFLWFLRKSVHCQSQLCVCFVLRFCKGLGNKVMIVYSTSNLFVANLRENLRVFFVLGFCKELGSKVMIVYSTSRASFHFSFDFRGRPR